MATGTIKHWNADRGFGFIRSNGSDDLFVHVTNVVGRPEAIEVGRSVHFTESTDRRSGRPCAVDVRLV
jgi:CspA family cold shock protein